MTPSPENATPQKEEKSFLLPEAAALEKRLATALSLKDPADRLLALGTLRDDAERVAERAQQAREEKGFSIAMLGGLVTAGVLVLSLPLATMMGAAAGIIGTLMVPVTIITGAAGIMKHMFQKLARTVDREAAEKTRDDAKAASVALIKATSLSELAASPQAEKMLSDFPGMANAFAVEAVRKAKEAAAALASAAPAPPSTLAPVAP